MKCASRLLFIIAISFTCFAQSQADFAVAQHILGREGKFQAADGVEKFSFPRTDLSVSIGATRLEPAAALGSWIAFRRSGSGFVADGDLVLRAAEVGPVISALIGGGVEIAGIHNHLVGEVPAVTYVHFFARGQIEQLASTFRSALNVTATPLAAPSPPAKPQPFAHQDVIEKILGKSGAPNGKALAFSFPRSHPITMHGETLPPSMGMATAVNFQSSPQGVAATGDFVLTSEEVPKVLAVLRKNGIQVTALHNHLLDDRPAMYFMHFWAEGKAESVAAGLKQALDAASGGSRSNP